MGTMSHDDRSDAVTDDVPAPLASSPQGAAARSRPAVHAPAGTSATALGATFARAFADDPVWDHLCGGDAQRYARWATRFFTTETHHHLRLDAVTATEDLQAGALWAPPGRWKSGLGDAARVAPWAAGLFGRRLPMAIRVFAELEKAHPTEKHWYLALLGTDPDHQGRGYGSAVLAPILDRCDATHTAAYLESSKEKNVPFYERHGFTVTERIEVDRGRGPAMWLMWRDPR